MTAAKNQKTGLFFSDTIYQVFDLNNGVGSDFHNLLCITFSENIPQVLEIKNIVDHEFLIAEKLTCAGVNAIGDIAEDEKSVEIYLPTYNAKTAKPGQPYDFWKVQCHFLNKPSPGSVLLR